jgi:hypothetical protein
VRRRSLARTTHALFPFSGVQCFSLDFSLVLGNLSGDVVWLMPDVLSTESGVFGFVS